MTSASTPTSFFVAGGTVPPGSPSYVERAADRELLQSLIMGEFCFVLNARQMGKSSLAVRTIGRLEEAGVRCAFVDLTRIGGATVTPEQWYAGLLLETGRALGMRAEAAAWLKAHRDVGPAQRLLSFLHEEALARLEGNIVLMIDEIDAVRSLAFSTDELFAGLRQLHNGRASDPRLNRLTVCLLGAALPSDLIRDPRTTPFNVGRRIELRDFAPEEARPFEAVVGGATLARVLHWTGGHPFLTQALCAELSEGSADPWSAKGARTPGPPDAVDALVRARYLDARARDTDTNLTDVARRLLGEGDPDVDEAARADTLSLYERILKGQPVVDDEANPAAARIKMSGVARIENGNLKPRNRIYAAAFDDAWVRDNMPGGELRRQKKAFWRGALRTGLVAAAVVATVGGLAWNNARLADAARAAERRALANEKITARNLYESQVTQAGKELFGGSLIDVERVLGDTRSSPSRNLEWSLIEDQTRRGLRRLPVGPLSRDVLFDADGKTLWANDRFTLRQFDATTWKEIRSIPMPRSLQSMNGIALDRRHGRIAAPSDSGLVAIWNLSGDARPRVLDAIGLNRRKGEAGLLSADFSPDGRWLVVGSANLGGASEFAYVYRTSDWSCVKRIPIPGNVQSLRFSPDGRTLAAADWAVHGRRGAGVSWIDVRTWTLTERKVASSEGVARVAWSPDGRYVAGCTSDGGVRLYDAARRLVRTFSAQTRATKIVMEFHPSDGTSFAQTQRSRVGTEAACVSVAFSRDGRRLVAGGIEGAATVWDVESGALLRSDRIKSGALWDASASPGSSHVAFAGIGRDGLVVLDLDAKPSVVELDGPKGAIFGLCASPSGRYLAAADWKGILWVWDLDEGFKAKRFPYAGRAIDARWTAEDAVTLLEWPGETREVRVDGTPGPPAPSPASAPAWLSKRAKPDDWKGISDNGVVDPEGWVADIVGATPGTTGNGIHIYEPSDHRRFRTIPAEAADGVAWGRDRRLMLSEANEVRIIETRTGRTTPLRGHTNWIRSMAESADGSRIVTASDDGTARVWSAETGGCLLTIPHPGAVLNALLLPRGDYLATVCGDLKVRLWPMTEAPRR